MPVRLELSTMPVGWVTFLCKSAVIGSVNIGIHVVDRKFKFGRKGFTDRCLARAGYADNPIEPVSPE